MGYKYISIRSDNKIAIAYVNNKGGLVSSSCDRLPKEIWVYCVEINTWLSLIHIPGKENNEGDYMSRLLHENTECKLDLSVFQKILKLFSVTLRNWYICFLFELSGPKLNIIESW